MLPGETSCTTIRFYVRTRSGVWVESPSVKTIEEARTEMAREWWVGREPAIVKSETVEIIVEEGK